MEPPFNLSNSDSPAMSSAFGMGAASIQFHGLTKREAAAIAIMQGIVSNPTSADQNNGSLVQAAVILADMLFDELERTPRAYSES